MEFCAYCSFKQSANMQKFKQYFVLGLEFQAPFTNSLSDYASDGIATISCPSVRL